MYKKAAIAVLVVCGLIFGGALVSKAPCLNKPEPVIIVEETRVVGLEETYLPGEIISLRVLEGKTGFVKVNYQWFILDAGGNLKNNSIVFPGGESVFFGAGIVSPNKFTVILVANYLMPKDELVTKTYTGKVFVGTKPGPGPEPGPGPTPPPTPNPDPTFPDGKYKLASFAYRLAKENITTANKAAVAHALAESYNSVASAINAGAYTDVQTILQKTKEANLAALAKSGAVIKDWEPFQVKSTDYIYEFYKNGSLRTATDFATAWRELAEGLSKIQ